jgi:hypothetical protein
MSPPGQPPLGLNVRLVSTSYRHSFVSLPGVEVRLISHPLFTRACRSSALTIWLSSSSFGLVARPHLHKLIISTLASHSFTLLRCSSCHFLKRLIFWRRCATSPLRTHHLYQLFTFLRESCSFALLRCSSFVILSSGSSVARLGLDKTTHLYTGDSRLFALPRCPSYCLVERLVF